MRAVRAFALGFATIAALVCLALPYHDEWIGLVIVPLSAGAGALVGWAYHLVTLPKPVRG